ncbi:MAG: hypothetical protein KIH08_15670 [Candidatus Freyarchaeota archaeon]|nr:hypothetical protein [Candidatus Jordarchaeia archaeon]MBS7270585.1 hypothetical protein [Candidatus Jordarchaeia archaeon]MBS7281475.1 hypothetical protein [Candidatus Jordarchaeia archaeon]
MLHHLVDKYASHFVAQRIGEELTENIKTLEQLIEYLISLVDKYHTPYCAFMYAQYKCVFGCCDGIRDNRVPNSERSVTLGSLDEPFPVLGMNPK